MIRLPRTAGGRIALALVIINEIRGLAFVAMFGRIIFKGVLGL